MVVFDTNIYYRNADSMRRWLDANGLVVFFTPNNALELMTPNSEAKCRDLEKRKQAVRNLLALTDNGQRELPDTEIFHAIQLGFRSISSGPWVEAAERFLTISEFTPQACRAAGLDMQPALNARNGAYDHFVQKVKTCQAILQDRWTEVKEEVKAIGGNYDMWRSPEVIRGMMSALETREGNIAAHVERIHAVAKEMQMEGTLVEQSHYESSIGIYIQAYVGYLQYALCTGKQDKNDFGDLQFFAYCDGGYRLVSSENRWRDISVQEGLEHCLFHFV